MKYTKLLLVVAVFIFGQTASAETLQLYPKDDAVNPLSDLDGQTEWSTARSYTGEIMRDPVVISPAPDQGITGVRSDNRSGFYRIYRASKVFDLSEIPANAVITNATLHLFKSVGNNGNDDTEVVVTAHTRDNVAQLQKQDWYIQKYGTEEFSRALLLDNQYTRFELTAAGREYVQNSFGDNLTLGLLTEFDFDDVEPTNGQTFRASWYEIEEVSTDRDPYLEIEFEVPVDEREGLYTQIVSPYPSELETESWAGDEYAAGESYQCGGTIAECGCVITSLVMAAQERGISVGVDGSEVNPGNFNMWLTNNNGYDVAGNIFWSTAADYFGTRSGSQIQTPFTAKNTKVLSANDISTAVADSSEAVIGYKSVAGHFFYLPGLADDGNALQVLDPLWYNTLTTNDVDDRSKFVRDYENEIDRGVVYSFENSAVQTGIIEATLNSPAELVLIDQNGLITGSEAALQEIPNSQYVQDEVILNQLSSSTASHFTKHLYASQQTGTYELRVVGTGTGSYTLTISMKTEDGQNIFEVIEGETAVGQVDEFIVNVATGEVTPVEDEVDEITREVFLAAVANATEDVRPRKARLLTRAANRIFNSIDRDRSRVALVKLRVFKKLLRYARVHDQELNQLITDLRKQIKES